MKTFVSYLSGKLSAKHRGVIAGALAVVVLLMIPGDTPQAQTPPLSKDKTAQAVWEAMNEANMRQDPVQWITIMALNAVYNDQTPPVSREQALQAIVAWQEKYQQWNEVNKAAGLVDKLDAGISLLSTVASTNPAYKPFAEVAAQLNDKVMSPVLKDKAKIPDAVTERQQRYQL